MADQTSENASSPDALPSIFRAGNDVVTRAYELGREHGRREGYEEQANDHHNWLLSHDETLAQVAADARRIALTEAAEAWDDEANAESLNALANEHYRAGGPSMPTIWLRLRAKQATEWTYPPDQRPDGGAHR